ncbi:MAG: aminotransferase class I/II-fold pyridoxal phosphate-dependent enzyme [Pseudomonadota bacterium]
MKSPTNPVYMQRHIRTMIDPRSGTHHRKYVLGTNSARPGDITMQSNDYLSLASDPRIAKAKSEVLLAEGHGDAISRVFAHHREDRHRAFERRIAALMQADDAVLAMSGYNANVGLIEAFGLRDAPVYIDQRAHASLWAGIASAGANPVPFRHNNAHDLEKKIARKGPGLVVFDTLYSTNGAVAPVHDLVDVAEAGGCVIVADETHSLGTHGPDGAGMIVAEGLAHRVHLRTAGLSKAMAARGGVVVGSAANMECFRYNANPMIFSTAVLGYEIAGFAKTLDIIALEPWRTRRLHANHRAFKEGLMEEGFNVAESDSQIVSLVTGSDQATAAFRDALIQRGLVGSVFMPPATPNNASLIRFTLNAELTRDEIERAIRICAEARDALRLAPSDGPLLAA